jgi:hypothetical protein
MRTCTIVLAAALAGCTSAPYVKHTTIEATGQRTELVCTNKRLVVPWYVGVAGGFFTTRYGEECHEEVK